LKVKITPGVKNYKLLTSKVPLLEESKLIREGPGRA